MFKASQYKLQIFDSCPFQYKCIYIDGLADVYRQHRPYFTMGDNIHAALKDFMSVIPVQNRNLKIAHQLLRTKWRRMRKGFKDSEEEKKWGQKALLQIENFVCTQDLSITPFLVEDYHDTQIDQDLTLLGRIDRVDKIKNELHVIDYKTGKLVPEEINTLQLFFYSIILERKFRLPVKRASFHFLAENKIIDFEPKSADLEKTLLKIKKEVKRILAEKTFEASPNKYCSTCDFIGICPKKDLAQNQKQKENDLPF